MGVKRTSPRRCGPGKAGAFAAAVGLGLSAMVVALPALASAAPVTQTFDIWNLTSTALNVTGYDKAGTYRVMPPESLPPDKVIPIGKNLQLNVPAGYGVITNLAGSQQAQQGGTQTWQFHSNLEILDHYPERYPYGLRSRRHPECRMRGNQRQQRPSASRCAGYKITPLQMNKGRPR